MTHIESTLPEIVGSEVVGLSLRDADGLAAAALYDLVQKATGCRLPQPDGTPSSEVEELLALCSAVLRRHWQTPLTMLDGLSLQDLVSRLMADRVEGNAALGIPAVNGSVTEALSALLERKITGAPEVADGMSLVRLFCDSAVSASLTTLTDPTTGWEWNHEFPLTSFPNLERISFNCISATKMSITGTGIIDVKLDFCKQIIANNKPIIWDIDGDEVMEFPELVTMEMNSNNALFGNFHKCKKLILPKLRTISKVGNAHFCSDFPNLIELHAPNFSGQTSSYGASPAMFIANPNLRWVRFGHFSTDNFVYGTLFEECPNLIKFEPKSIIGTLNAGAWNPAMALRTDTTAEDYVDLREDTAFANNLLQFLSNFREFLFLRLADRTGQSALTLTLSQAVYQAITGTDTTTTALTLTLNQLGITDLTDKETQAGITLNTTYATWLETYRDAINWNIGYV